MLAVVLFAIARFLAGMSTKLRTPGPRTVPTDCLVFAGTAAWIATFPISVSV